MAENTNRWGDIKGWLANQLASGKVYNTYTNTYAPRNVTGTRLASGVVNQLGGPVGTIAGLVGHQASKHMDGAQRFDRTLQTAPSFWDERKRLQQSMSGMNDVDVDDIRGPMGIGNVSPGGNGQAGNLAGMVSNRSPYGPYQGGYQLPQGAPPQGTTSGLPDSDQGYASLPYYGQAPQQPPTDLAGPTVRAPQIDAQSRFSQGGLRAGQSGWGGAAPGQFNIRNYLASKPAMDVSPDFGGGGTGSQDGGYLAWKSNKTN